MLEPWWITGFVDGEGCFSIDIIRNTTLKSGIQFQPSFTVTQSVLSIDVLESLQSYFGCGQIQMNVRKDNHHYDLANYRVRKLSDLSNTIIPFFNRYPLKTAKHRDFMAFAFVVEMMTKRQHLSASGLQQILKLKCDCKSFKV